MTTDATIAAEVARMLVTINRIRHQVSADNIGFYDRLKAEIENGQIGSFGELCERLPNFIVDQSDEMRSARHAFRYVRDSREAAVAEFKSRSKAEIKVDIQATNHGSLPNIFLRVLRDMINDFAGDPAWFDAWITLRDSARLQRYPKVDTFLASVPEPLRSKAGQQIVNILPQ